MTQRQHRRGFAGIALAIALTMSGVGVAPAFASDAGSASEGAAETAIAAGQPGTATVPDEAPPADADGSAQDQSQQDAAALVPEQPEASSEVIPAQDAQVEHAEQADEASQPSAPASPASPADAPVPPPMDQAKVTVTPVVSPDRKLRMTGNVDKLDSAVSAISAALIRQGDELSLGTGAATGLPRTTAPLAVTNGAATVELTAAPGALVKNGKYELVVWNGGDAPTAETAFARAPLELTSAQWAALSGETVQPEPAEVGSLHWGVLDRFRAYVEGPIAKGKISAQKPAKYDGSEFDFPQITGGKWESGRDTGTVQFAGSMRFLGHAGQLDLNMSNPMIRVIDSRRAELSVRTVSVDMLTQELRETVDVIATIDLTKAQRSERSGGAIRWSNAPATLTTAGVPVFQDFYEAGQELAPITFTVGAASDAKPVTPTKPKPVTPTKPKPVDPVQPVAPTDGAQQAGSLTWGISSGYAAYTTGRIAKGNITSSGVGGGAGGYVFPQASSSWDAQSQTGTVQYSGVVTFTGHKGLMSESFANPVISITGPASGTLTAGGRSFGLDLGAGSKSVGANGEVTWSGVPLSGAIAGGGGGGGGAFGADPVSFTIGAVSGASFGSTAVGPQNTKRTAADAPPATTGIRILTDSKKLVPGGEIEFEASGFEAGERDVLVVLYSDPIVLDDAAGADANGVVRWIGTLPKDLTPGEHTITLQGSTNAGAVFTVSAAKKAKAKSAEQQSVEEIVAEANAQTPVAAGIAPGEDTPIWLWWAGAIALLAVAGAMGGLVVAQRRKAAAAVGISGDE